MYNQFARQSNDHEDWKIVDKFDSTYWSGLDVQVYANNILLDEAIQVSYVINEQVRPYYGYASYVPDRLYHGARIIQGELTLNFKKDGYLFSLVNLLINQDPKNIWLPTGKAVGPTPSVQTGVVGDVRPPIDYDQTPYGPQLWEQIKTNGIDPTVARRMVDARVKASSTTAVNKYSPNIHQKAGLFQTKENGFDLNVIFGGDLSASQTLKYADDGSFQTDNGEYAFRQGRVIQEAKAKVASTGIKIIGVSIAGLARTINDDGRPIMETYSFFAKDIQILRNVGTAVSTTLNAEQPSDTASNAVITPPVRIQKTQTSVNPDDIPPALIEGQNGGGLMPPPN